MEWGSREFQLHPQEAQVRARRLCQLSKQSDTTHSYGGGPGQGPLSEVPWEKLLGGLGKRKREGQAFLFCLLRGGGSISRVSFGGQRERETFIPCKTSLRGQVKAKVLYGTVAGIQ